MRPVGSECIIRTMQTWEKIKRNPKLLEKYLVREKVTDSIRIFFKSKGFREVQTPILVPVPSCEPNLEVFRTELSTLKGVKRKAFLIMSPEYSIKKLLSSGIGNCFEITRCFRNSEEVSRLHQPEFTMLEWYRINANYLDIMKDFENLFIEIVSSLGKNINLKKWMYQDKYYDISIPWLRVSVAEAFEKYAEIDTETLLSKERFLEKAKEKKYSITEKSTWEELFHQILFNEVEPGLLKLHKPYFLYDYPVSLASLSRKKPSDPRFAERFEVFLAGIELGNCFSELTDANEQKMRFINELRERKNSGKTEYPIDKELIKALASGIPKVAGIAVGVDRLIMLVGNLASISDTNFFPAQEIFDLTKT